MKNWIAFVGMLLAFSSLKAQKVLMEEDVNADTVESNYGHDKRHFVYSTYGYGLILGESENKGSAVKTGLATSEYYLGITYKYKVFNGYCLNTELMYLRSNFVLDQTEDKTLPDSLPHDREWLVSHQLALQFSNRIQISQRGTNLGTYLDLGGYFDWVIGARHRIRDELSDSPNNAGNVKVRYADLEYFEPFNYGLFARLGSKNFAGFARYRLSDRFRSRFDYGELPRLTVGIEMAIAP
ncbi:MAG: hypothetical protein ACFB10_13805 [Salibacteraceae bacterium]